MSTTLADAVHVFLNRYRKKTTRDTYANDLNYLLRFIAPHIAVTSITGFDVERALGEYMQVDGVESVHTINKFIKTVHTFFNWCEKKSLITSATKLKPDYLPVPENNVSERTMSEADYLHLVSFYSALAAAHPKKYQRPLALILFLGDTGTRRAGLAGLTWRDIDFVEKEAITLEKGDKQHTRSFGAATASVLRQWNLIQKIRDDIPPMDATVFSQHGQKMTAPSIAQYFRRRCVEAGVNGPGKRGYGPHAVRHLLGFRLQDAKVPDNLAAAVMGHSVNTYRKHYASTDKNRVKEAANEVAFRFSDLPAKETIIEARFKSGTENP